MAAQRPTQYPSPQTPQIQPCRYKTGKTLGAGSYSVVKECVHIDTGRYFAAKVINKRMMAGREHMVGRRKFFACMFLLHRLTDEIRGERGDNEWTERLEAC